MRPWLVFNPGSGSTSSESGEVLAAALTDAGWEPVGTTHFPVDAPPDREVLDAAGADTLVVMGGDGTINAVTSELDEWPGVCLVLPGGTMNILARALHDSADWQAVLREVPGAPAEPLPCATVGEHRALVGLIIGPAAAWVHARERVRAGRLAGLRRALLFAWRKSWRRTVRVAGGAHGVRGHRAVIVTPHPDDLEIVSISPDDWFGAARLGWSWLAGDWRQAPDVRASHATEVRIGGARTITVLVDGEMIKLPAPIEVRHGATRLRYIQTKRPPELEPAHQDAA